MTAPTPPAAPAGPAEGTAPEASPEGAGEQPQTPAGQEPTNDGEPFDADRAREAIQKKNSEAKNLRERLAAAEAQIAEAERAKMSEAERIAADRDSFKTRAETAEQTLARFEVAAEKGLDPQAMQFLTGSTREELAASADVLKTLLAQAAPAASAAPAAQSATQRPAEALRVPAGGSDPGAQLTADDLDPAKLAAQLRRSR